MLYGDSDEIADAFGEAIRSRPADEEPLEAVAGALQSLTQIYAGDVERTFLQAQLAARFMVAVASCYYENINDVPLWRLLCPASGRCVS